ncbi:PAS domain S-box protein [Aerosakkonemataceae cyanobacterium BLCC-F154]|uniref:histidine kinase n=1 Tax=Floridaenema fluviatile BLCC-F154 TaxID=3153640 RepID=A0ABV4YKR7_9CYAN
MESDSLVGSLRSCQKKIPDVILLDYDLFVRGEQRAIRDSSQQILEEKTQEFLSQLEAEFSNTDIPVIALLEQENETIADRLIEQGVQDYLIQENLTADLLCRTVRNAIKQGHLQRQIAQLRTEIKKPFVTLAESSPVGIYRTDVNGKCTYVNQHWCELTGLTAAEVVGEGWDSVLHPDDRDRIATEWYESVVKGTTFKTECRFQTPNGITNWIVAQAVAEIDASGTITGYIGTIVDINKRKRLEEELQEREARLNAFFSSAPVGMMILDQNLQFLQVNEQLATIDNMTAEAYIGKTLWDISPEIARQITPLHEQVLETAKPILNQEVSVEILNQPGVKRTWIVSYFPIEKNASDRPSGVGGVVIEITDRKQAEEALRQSEKKHRALLKALPDLIMRINRAGIYLDFIATKTFKVLGKKEDFIGTHIRESLPHSLVEQRIAAIDTALQTGTIQIYEQELEVEGKIQTEEVRVVACGENETLLVVRDISARKEAEKKIRKSEAALAEAQRIAHIGNWEFDVEKQKITWSEELFRIYDWQTDRLEPTFAEHIQKIVHPEDREYFVQTVQRALLTGEPYLMEFKALRSDGSIRIIEGRGEATLNSQGQVIRLFGTAMDITQRKQAELALQSLVEVTASVTGEAFFPVLVEQIAIALNVTSVIVSEKSGDRLETLAIYSDRQLQPNFCRDIIGTPCEMVLQRGKYYWQENLNQIDFDFIPLESKSYLGTALRSTSGEIIGVLSVLDRQPIVNAERAEILLQIFASRASAELERQQATEALLQLNQELEIIVEQRTAALQQSQEELSTIFSLAAVGIVQIDAITFRFLKVNQKFCNTLGYTEAELTAKVVTEITHPEDIAETLSCMQQVCTGKINEFFVEKRYIRKDSSLLYAHANVSIVRRPDGTPEYYIAIIKDISDRKQAELALRESEERFRTLFEATPNPIQGFDKERRVIFWNRASEELYGYTCAEAMGQRVEELIIPKQMWAEMIPVIDAWIADIADPLPHGELQLQNKKGELVEVYSNHLTLKNLNGESEMYCLDMDLRDRKLLEQELRQMNAVLERRVEERTIDLQKAMETAEAANRAKSIFLANMSHELRTPLNAILGFTQLMSRDRTLKPENQEQLSIINRSGTHLLNLINDILEMSKIEAECTTINLTRFDLQDLLYTVKQMFQLRAEHKGLKLICHYPPELPNYIETDEGKLRQILINLLGNAIKFTQTGKITLQVQCQDSKARNQNGKSRPISPSSHLRLKFEVKDTGPGIDPNELHRLFEPFVQLKNPKLSQEGTGLGLAISYQFVRLLGGELQVFSTLGKGATFRFEIPVTLVSAADTVTKLGEKRAIALAPNQPSYRILIVEDDWASRQLLLNILQIFGFQVKAVVNGQEAVTVWQKWQPHLIWMDIRMPIMDGYEATRQIRAIEKSQLVNSIQPTKIIALTAGVFEENRDRVIAAGCDDFIPKPLHESNLLDKLIEHLGVHFIYEEIFPRGRWNNNPKTTALKLEPSVLQVMPPEWLFQFYQAIIHLNSTNMLKLVAQIPPEHQALAEALREKINNFDFEQLMVLFQSATKLIK